MARSKKRSSKSAPSASAPAPAPAAGSVLIPGSESVAPTTTATPGTSTARTSATPITTSSSSSSNPGPSSSAAGSVLKQRRPGPAVSKAEEGDLLAEEKGAAGVVRTTRSTGDSSRVKDRDEMPWAERNTWIVYAVASGACAAFNGVFAKLTTDGLTTQIARGISGFLSIENIDGFLEIVVRCAFFGLNILFNIIMWTLFTQALAKGNSTTQVSIMNTSTNFMISALLGLAIFAESLPPLWWAGATLLVAGNVILGRKDGESGGIDAEADAHAQHEGAEAAERGQGVASLPGLKEQDEIDEDVPLLGDLDSSPHNR
ncbi:hypothetical protein F5Y07DRAFT_398113 [Xylaria sp. FL0933]|nr:hypothetical protein F5Y07DRAFT_398113 [Xylaria sp. FL0933]